ncbi:MAG: hypothetical protein ABSB35_28925 [Bryobacteraceae bacterium]|jgi:two-component system sensor histidine kinase KdpD
MKWRHSLVNQVQSEKAQERTGRLKVFLGYASGVGKSFRMFDEGRRRQERGEDVVVGAIQSKISPEFEILLTKLEIIPLKVVNGVPAMDVPRILESHPEICLVDGLAHDNPPSSDNPSRWQDVQDLLTHGIAVIASVNIQNIDELRESTESITGEHVTQVVPRSFLNAADEIVVVDAPPETCISRTSDRHAESGQSSEVQKLSELRKIALLFAADMVDRQLEAHLQHNGIPSNIGRQERILIYVTPGANAVAMIQSGRRNADRFQGGLTVAYVRQPDLSADDQAVLDRNLALARDAHAQIEILEGEDAVNTILKFARDCGITQIFVRHGTGENWRERLTGTPLDRLIRGANDIDVRVFPH